MLADAVSQAAESCKKLGAPEADIYAVDLTNGKQLADLVQKIEAKHQMVNVLVNNAGTPWLICQLAATSCGVQGSIAV